jgi:hypothetical protein
MWKFHRFFSLVIVRMVEKSYRAVLKKARAVLAGSGRLDSSPRKERRLFCSYFGG